MSAANPSDTPSAPAPPAPIALTPKPARNGSGIVSLIALAIALLTAGYVLYRDPPGGRLSKYDFTSPEQALHSELRIRAKGDYLAWYELDAKLVEKEAKERLATMEIKRVSDWDGRTALFVQFTVTNRNTKEPREQKMVIWYEKEEGSGYWRQTFIDTARVRMSNRGLADDIDAWNGPRLGMPGFGD